MIAAPDRIIATPITSRLTSFGVEVEDASPLALVTAIGSNIEVVKVGDKILYSDHPGSLAEKHEVEGVDYVFLREFDLLAVVE